jgi:molybdopterin biosynthesis enzyme MoaB
MTADDVTPEATRDAIDRDAPGYAETIRQESRRHTPLGILTRGISGIRGRTLVINFPGSPKAIGQSWPVVEPTLKHAAATLERE